MSRCKPPARSETIGEFDNRVKRSSNDTLKPTFPAPDHDHDRCTGRASACRAGLQAQGAEIHPIRRQVLQALLSSHRPLGAYEVIDELAKSMPRPGRSRCIARSIPDGERSVHRIESRNAFLACAHDHDAAAMVRS